MKNARLFTLSSICILSDQKFKGSGLVHIVEQLILYKILYVTSGITRESRMVGLRHNSI